MIRSSAPAFPEVEEKATASAEERAEVALQRQNARGVALALKEGASPVGLIARAARSITSSTPVRFLDELLQLGADPNEGVPSDPENTALGLALFNANRVWTARLLRAGADPNRGVASRTPLRLALVAGNAALARLLLKKGADPLREADPHWWPQQNPFWHALHKEIQARTSAGELSKGLPGSQPRRLRSRL